MSLLSENADVQPKEIIESNFSVILKSVSVQLLSLRTNDLKEQILTQSNQSI